jgi:UDP-N-acetylmuramyl pentapeptide synthase
MEPERVHRSQDAEEARRLIPILARPGDLILVKASRVAGLDQLALALREVRIGADPGPVAATKGAGG